MQAITPKKQHKVTISHRNTDSHLCVVALNTVTNWCIAVCIIGLALVSSVARRLGLFALLT